MGNIHKGGEGNPANDEISKEHYDIHMLDKSKDPNLDIKLKSWSQFWAHAVPTAAVCWAAKNLHKTKKKDSDIGRLRHEIKSALQRILDSLELVSQEHLTIDNKTGTASINEIVYLEQVSGSFGKDNLRRIREKFLPRDNEVFAPFMPGPMVTSEEFSLGELLGGGAEGAAESKLAAAPAAQSMMAAAPGAMTMGMGMGAGSGSGSKIAVPQEKVDSMNKHIKFTYEQLNGACMRRAKMIRDIGFKV